MFDERVFAEGSFLSPPIGLADRSVHPPYQSASSVAFLGVHQVEEGLDVIAVSEARLGF